MARERRRASASALARACAGIEESGGGTARACGRAAGSRRRRLWKVYDVVASVAPTSEVVPVFDARGGSASAASRADADAGDAGSARRKTTAAATTTTSVARRASARLLERDGHRRHRRRRTISRATVRRTA